MGEALAFEAGGEIAAQGAQIQESPGALRAMGHLAVAVDARGGDIHFGAEEGDEFFEDGELPRRGAFFLEVSDQADPDAVVVEEIVGAILAEVLASAGGAVGAVDLAFPARADEDLAVGVVYAIADDEVIAEAVFPVAAVEVPLVHSGGGGVFGGGVMDDDDLPLVAADALGG